MPETSSAPSGLGLLGLLGASLALGLVVKGTGPPSPEEWENIRSLGRLGEYRPPPYRIIKQLQEEATEAKETAKQPLSVEEREIGPYVVEAKRYRQTCSIKVYQNLPGWRRKTIGVWSGAAGACAIRVGEVADAIHEARARQKGLLPPAPPKPQVFVSARPEVPRGVSLEVYERAKRSGISFAEAERRLAEEKSAAKYRRRFSIPTGSLMSQQEIEEQALAWAAELQLAEGVKKRAQVEELIAKVEDPKMREQLRKALG
jgi:hypothetical protein